MIRVSVYLNPSISSNQIRSNYGPAVTISTSKIRATSVVTKAKLRTSYKLRCDRENAKYDDVYDADAATEEDDENIKMAINAKNSTTKCSG